jgi:hypothetical protein
MNIDFWAIELNAAGLECPQLGSTGCAKHVVPGSNQPIWNFVTQEPAFGAGATDLHIGGSVAVSDIQASTCTTPGLPNAICPFFNYTVRAISSETAIQVGASTFTVPAGSYLFELMVKDWLFAVPPANQPLRIKVQITQFPFEKVTTSASDPNLFNFPVTNGLHGEIGFHSKVLVGGTARNFNATITPENGPSPTIKKFNLDIPVSQTPSEESKVRFTGVFPVFFFCVFLSLAPSATHTCRTRTQVYLYAKLLSKKQSEEADEAAGASSLLFSAWVSMLFLFVSL